MISEHLSGRYDVDPSALRAALVKQLADGPEFVSHTEMGRDARAAVLDDFPAYDVIRFNGLDGRDECALQVRAGRKVISAKPVKLSDLPIPRRGDKLCFALHVQFEDHHRIIVHMPSGVEGTNGFLDNTQARVYRTAIAGLKKYVATLDGPVVITGDWNLSLRKGWVRTYFAEAFPRFTTSWLVGNLPELGTHGTRVIDFSLVRGLTVTDARVVSAFGASDHRAIRETHTRKETTVSRTPKTDALVAALRRRGVEVLTHAQWGAKYRDVYARRLDTHHHGLLPGKPVDTLWHHVTVTLDHGPLTGDFARDLRTVEQIGYDRFGSGISYNILVDRNAPHPRVAIGMPLEAKGTHTVNDKGIDGYSYNQNLVALAVAWIAMPGDQLNEHGRTAFVQVAAALIEVGALTTTYDSVPHSLVAAKDCPTAELRDQLPGLKRDALAAAKPAPAPAPKPTPRWDSIWETANSIAKDVPAGTARGDAARQIRTIAAKHSTKH